METIKCKNCGCEMSAMSESCPLCGTPVATQESTETHPQGGNPSVENKSESATSIEPYTIDELRDSAKTLAEALDMAVGHVKAHPLEWVGLRPYDNSSEEFKQAFDMSNLLIGYGSISNKPIVHSELDYETSEFDGRQVLTLEDCNQYASDFAKLFAKKGISDIDQGYEFTTMAALNVDFSSSSEEISVMLYLKPECEDFSMDIMEFNQMAPAEYGQLAYNSEHHILQGEIRTIPVTGGMFEKKRKRKANEERFQALHNLILKFYPYLKD